MKFVIDIPEREFGVEIADHFQDFYMRLQAEIQHRLSSNDTLLCGNYELGTVEMLLKSFKNATLEQESKTDGDCIREKDDEAIEKKLRLAGYEKVVTCAECVHGVEVGPCLYKCLDCDWIGDDDFWCKEGKRREE